VAGQSSLVASINSSSRFERSDNTRSQRSAPLGSVLDVASTMSAPIVSRTVVLKARYSFRGSVRLGGRAGLGYQQSSWKMSSTNRWLFEAKPPWMSVRNRMAGVKTGSRLTLPKVAAREKPLRFLPCPHPASLDALPWSASRGRSFTRAPPH
jgi:hypothetical protein